MSIPFMPSSRAPTTLFGGFGLKGRGPELSATQLLQYQVNARPVLVGADERATGCQGGQRHAASAVNHGIAYQQPLGSEAPHDKGHSFQQLRGTARGIASQGQER